MMHEAANLDVTLPMLLPGIRVKTSPAQFVAVHDVQFKRLNGDFWGSVSDAAAGE